MKFYNIGVDQSQDILKVVVIGKRMIESVKARKHVGDLAVCFYQLFESTNGIDRDLLMYNKQYELNEDLRLILQ